MSTIPAIAIYVRHSAGCKYEGDEYARRCTCRKHLRWSQDGKQYRRAAKTRSWAEAERVKRALEEKLAAGKPADAPESKPEAPRDIRSCIDAFLADKKVQGITRSGMGKYIRELERLRAFCEHRGVYEVQDVSREVLTRFLGTWDTFYPSSFTRAKARERLRAFLRYCYQAEWINRVPELPKIKAESPETLPLTEAEFKRLLAAIPKAIGAKDRQAQLRALFLLMRWSGLAIQDALTLPRTALRLDKGKGMYRVTTSRQKTGVHVGVPLPPEVARELLALPGTDEYFLWSGNGSRESLVKRWSKFVAPVFKAAGLHGAARMTSHRLRDTFAVDLLQKGVPMEEVSKLLGHTSIKTTEKHYAKWSKGRQDRLDSLVIATWSSL